MINSLNDSDRNLIERYAFLIKDNSETEFRTNDEFEDFLLREFDSSEKGRLQFLLSNIIPNTEPSFQKELLDDLDLSKKQFFLNEAV